MSRRGSLRKSIYILIPIAIALALTAYAAYRLSISPTDEEHLVFAVLGDSQGRSATLRSIIGEINKIEPDFVIHLGDCVSIAAPSLFDRFAEELDPLGCPYHITPGNHDIKGNGSVFYDYFGPGDYTFERGGLSFISIDTSNESITDSQFAWLEETLSLSAGKVVVVFTHVPPYDPLPDSDHSLIDPNDRTRLIDLMTEYGVEMLISGHIHIYNRTSIGGVEYVISGGGGAELYAGPEMGGFHHFLVFEVEGGELDMEVVRVEPPETERTVDLVGRSGNLSLTLDELSNMGGIVGASSFQNNLGNWRGQGEYAGIPIRDLVEMVGGMARVDVLEARSPDGYVQRYGYGNVYPNSSWEPIQGTMILAFRFNEAAGEDWERAPLIAFLPEDGRYSNEDCLHTSYQDQGCNVYLSAGSRWVKQVAEIAVVPGKAAD